MIILPFYPKAYPTLMFSLLQESQRILNYDSLKVTEADALEEGLMLCRSVFCPFQMKCLSPLAGHFAAAIRTCRDVAVGEDGVSNPTA